MAADLEQLLRALSCESHRLETGARDGAGLHRAKPVCRSRNLLSESSGSQSGLLAGSEEPRGSAVVCRKARGGRKHSSVNWYGNCPRIPFRACIWVSLPTIALSMLRRIANLRVPENWRLPTRMCFRKCSKAILRLVTSRFRKRDEACGEYEVVRSSHFERRPCSTAMVA